MSSSETLQELGARLDREDRLAERRQLFDLPAGLHYFDGNSLGPLTRAARARLQQTVDQEWGRDLIRSWTKNGWLAAGRRIGARLAPLLGAAPDEILVADSTSINWAKLLHVALDLRPQRTKILCQIDHFPSNLYLTREIADARTRRLHLIELDRLIDELDDQVALVCFGQVDFRSGELFDLAALTRRAHEAGALVLVDLSHSVGALPLELEAAGVDLAVGCGYKFLNGGPGAPAFLYVRRGHLAAARNHLPGWLGHSDPFDFSSTYLPAAGIERFTCGTPPILSFVALEAALDAFADLDLAALRAKSLALGDHFLRWLDTEPAIETITPRQHERRGSQITIRHPQAAAWRDLLDRENVLADFRPPDLLRFGLAPLYLSFADVNAAGAALRWIANGAR